jgi:hypothetical protein
MDVGRDVIRQAVVLSESALFPAVGSLDEVRTDAVLVNTPATVGLITMATVATPPLAIDPR